MDPFTILGTALALAMDAFAVAAAVAAGLPKLTAHHVFRLAWHFGLFQAGMPILGWLGGRILSSVITALAPWIGFVLLAFLGLRMIWASRNGRNRPGTYDPTRGWSLVALSLATSIDALVVGISLGLLGLSIWIPALVIGCVALGLTYVGTHAGRRVGPYLGRWAERIGGGVLIAVGSRILVQHLMGM